MDNLERKVNLLIEFVTAEDETTRKKVIDSFRSLETATSQRQPADDKSIMRTVDDMLLNLGVPSHILGHAYIRQAIVLVSKTPELGHCITKGLYPTVAKNNNTTASRVERAIRHAIEIAWSRCDVEVLNRYFGHTVDPYKGKPTNSEFICQMAAEIRRIFDI